MTVRKRDRDDRKSALFTNKVNIYEQIHGTFNICVTIF